MRKNKNSIFKDIWLKRTNYLFILPFVLIFTMFTILPVGYSIFLSFCQYNVLQPLQFVGIDNYVRLFFEDEVFLTALMNTIVMAIVIGPVGYILSFLLAWLINELNPKLRSLYVLFFYAPSISGNLYVIFKVLFSDDANGYLNSILMYFGIIDENIYWLTDTDFMMPVCIITSLWMSMGAGFLSFVAGLQGIDRSQLEAGAIDGIRNRWQELWYIILPSMRPQLMFGAVMSITSAFEVGDLTQNLCGLPSTDYGVHTMVNHMTDYGYTKFEMGYACAVATLLFVIMLLCNNLFQRFLRRAGS